jgi:hypothetical protein
MASSITYKPVEDSVRRIIESRELGFFIVTIGYLTYYRLIMANYQHSDIVIGQDNNSI